MEKTVWPTSILSLLLRALQMELSQHSDPNPGTHTYAITTTNNQHRHTIFSLLRRTETQSGAVSWRESEATRGELSSNHRKAFNNTTVSTRSNIHSSSRLNRKKNCYFFGGVSWSLHLHNIVLPSLYNVTCLNTIWEIIGGFVAVCHGWIITVNSNTINQHSSFNSTRTVTDGLLVYQRHINLIRKWLIMGALENVTVWVSLVRVFRGGSIKVWSFEHCETHMKMTGAVCFGREGQGLCLISILQDWLLKWKKRKKQT